MPRIAPQHLNGKDPYDLVCSWPDDAYVQWGGAGLVINCNHPEKSYTTAFFEVFPGDRSTAGGIIRGEGATIADAEQDAFSHFTRQSNCTHHWGREHYLNGGALCRHCRAFQTVFKPVVTLGAWRSPLTDVELDMLKMSEENDALPDDNLWKTPYTPERLARVRRLRARLRLFGAA